MSMYTLLRNNSLPTPKEIENAFQGNYKARKKLKVKLDLCCQTARKFPRKYTQVEKQKQSNAEYPVTKGHHSTCCQTVKNLGRFASKFDLDQSERKLSHGDASARNAWTNRVSSRLASSCESVWPGVKISIKSSHICFGVV